MLELSKVADVKNARLVEHKQKMFCKFRPPDIVPRKSVRFLGLLGGLRPRSASRVEFPETACGFDSRPGREPRELAIDEANTMPPSCGRKKRIGFVRTVEGENPSQM